MITTKKVQVRKHIGHRGLYRKRKLAFKPGQAHKTSNGLPIHIVDGGIRTWSVFHMSGLNDAADFEIIHKA